jgi:hypothetical protein
MAKGTGGDKLRAHLKKIADNLAKAEAVRVGFLENARYPDAKGTSVPMVAAINEFGAPSRGQPPRPFFREMIKEKSPLWPEAISNLLKQNDYDARKTMNLVGAAVKGQLQQKINTYVGPPLRPSTIARKGHDKQLIHTSFMLKSVDFKVVTK